MTQIYLHQNLKDQSGELYQFIQKPDNFLLLTG